MAKSSFNQSPYYYGMPDVYMQMGYYPFPTPPATEQLPRHAYIPYPMSMASQCKYFLGQTEKVTVGPGGQGFGALSNPVRSGALLYVQDWHVTNLSEHPLEVQFWFGKTESIAGASSAAITSGFAQLSSCPPSQGKLLFSQSESDLPRGGTIATTRIVPPLSTVGAQIDGQWILGPGMSLMAHVPASEKNAVFLFSMGWWEQPVF
ncbi:DUF6143 family protein [Brevibacillus choshinensis]|uniref:Uncharacterized protein n=1 Tax=Brevibacillus choshinensis TaxID=54911 RepID=A0ABX7FUS5_BRECH|nr:DUF6143 family protein [Brevibacillus choshinensis]QRG68740.1 hypothetical protein JNE38_06205 [Brevibacillus choshinensis]